ncbi:MAG: YdcF family protein [Bryobacteraceae bacterium]
MQVNIPILRPEREVARQFQRSLYVEGRQVDGISSAICVLGTYFDPVEGPSPRMLSRMVHAQALVEKSRTSVHLIASGGIRGTGGALVTEAQLIDAWFRDRGFEPLLREDFSAETVGNLSLTFLGLMRPLGVQNVTVVTDECHAPRVEMLAVHILKGLVNVTVSAAPWPLSPEEADRQFRGELNGMPFIERLLDEVTPGQPDEAFEWVSSNHKSHPYLGWDIAEVVAILRGRVFDYAVSTGTRKTEVERLTA